MDFQQGRKLDSFVGQDIKSLSTKDNVIFTCEEKVGSLADVLRIFKENGISLGHIESRPSRRFPGCYEFLTAIGPGTDLSPIIDELKAACHDVMLYSSSPEKLTGSLPWFPKKIRDLDEFANRVLSYGSELDADHPGFTDPVYRARRKQFADIANVYRHGQKIPRVTYTDEEVGTWRTIFTELRDLYPTNACSEFNYAFPLLEQNCGYTPDTIPQLQDVSDFLKDCTGFSLRPVAGLLTSRDFLAGLAFRVFHSTQYIRHPSVPKYTPEPDVCHELLGHVPLFADPGFAAFSQEIGLISLGAPDEYIEKLATLYWFTIEFGVCLQNGKKKAYGAGLLSSFGELEYCLTDEPKCLPFDPEKTCMQKYPITQYQPVYYVAESFHAAKERLVAWAADIPRPFVARYNAYTQSVELVDNRDSVRSIVHDLRADLNVIDEALKKLG